MFRDTLKKNHNGRLEIGGVDCADLRDRFGTPLYCLDEAYIRAVCRDYRKVLDEKYPDSLVCYASKALSVKAMYKIVGSEGLGADVVSGGELYTAAAADFDLSKVYFHGNNKLPHEVELALNLGVHAIAVDGYSDIELLKDAVDKTGKTARVIVRLNPGVEAHTHHFVQTSNPDSKFGVSIADGTAMALIGALIETKGIDFIGIHCHIGSQIFEQKPFELAVERMTDFMDDIKRVHGVDVKELNLGGGYGIRYTSDDKPHEPFRYVECIVHKLKECLEQKKLTPPRLVLEPGRSIVGEAGITLYTVGAVKEIKNLKKYVSVDGGMFDNPRYALYQARYTAVAAERMDEAPTETVTIAGKCCESGDMLVVDAKLPTLQRGDLIAVLSTGAYNYSMASNYNRNTVPPMVLCYQGAADYIVTPQTYEELVAHDQIPTRLK